MENRLNIMLENHRLLCGEVFHQLNELNKLDKSKFSEKEKSELEISILDLENEYSYRKSFISELETLL